jgi:hypothetical protein
MVIRMMNESLVNALERIVSLFSTLNGGIRRKIERTNYFLLRARAVKMNIDSSREKDEWMFY